VNFEPVGVSLNYSEKSPHNPPEGDLKNLPNKKEKLKNAIIFMVQSFV